jgi:hypothetical protein
MGCGDESPTKTDIKNQCARPVADAESASHAITDITSKIMVSTFENRRLVGFTGVGSATKNNGKAMELSIQPLALNPLNAGKFHRQPALDDRL